MLLAASKFFSYLYKKTSILQLNHSEKVKNKFRRKVVKFTHIAVTTLPVYKVTFH